ncbi:MAG: hypothetical protein KAR21_18190, partial [Spirochaetales bacterium]|nr:hypothetical protein [Spirochaetales bacterium]
KRVKNLKSLYSRLYYIARHFFSASVDFRFDWNREQVIPVLNECPKITKCTNIYKNTVYLTEKNNRNYRIKIYDKKKDMERILEGIYYPIRLEVTIKGYKSQDLKGTAKRVIERNEMEIQKGFNSIPEY